MEDIKTGKKNSGTALDRLSESPSYIGGLATVAMVVIVTVNMISRKVINFPIPGFYDITGLMGIIFYSFGIVYAAIKGAHISVRVLVTRLPERYQRKLEYFNRIIIAAFSILLTYASASMVREQWLISEVTTDLKIPLTPFRLVVVAAFLLLTVLILAGKQISRGEGEE